MRDDFGNSGIHWPREPPLLIVCFDVSEYETLPIDNILDPCSTLDYMEEILGCQYEGRESGMVAFESIQSIYLGNNPWIIGEFNIDH